MWLTVLRQCVYEKRLYKSPSDSAIQLINKTAEIILTRHDNSHYKKKENKSEKRKMWKQ